MDDADRRGLPVRLLFRDGQAVTARIREIDRDRHHSLTYLDMDNACGAFTVPLEDIIDASVVTDGDGSPE